MPEGGRLAERLAAARARDAEAKKMQAQVETTRALAPALEALEAAGETFEVVPLASIDNWLPRWIAWGWGEVPWHLALAPHAEKPGIDPAARAAAARPMLEELAPPSAAVLFVYEDMWTAIRLPRAAALRHIEALMAVAPRYGDIWLLAPPADFIIRVDGDWVVSHVADPLPREQVARERAANRDGRHGIAPLRRVLVEAGVRVRYRYAYDLVSAREDRIGPPNIDRKRFPPSLSMAVPDDPAARDAVVRDFIDMRLGPDALLRLILPGGAPNLLILRHALDAHVRAILDACDRPVWLTAADPVIWFLELGPKWIYGYN